MLHDVRCCCYGNCCHDDSFLGSDAVQPDIVEKLPVQQRKRQEAIFELIQTEKSYVHSLNLVKEVGGINMDLRMWVWSVC